MKIGCCSDIKNIKTLEKLGINYIEIAAAWISALDDNDFEALIKTIENSPVKVEVCNIIIRGGLTPLFSDEGLKDAQAYLSELMPRISKIGAKMIVFGSGWYRNAPQGVTVDDKKQRVAAFLRLLAQEAEKYGITVLIEPLNQKETNVLITTTEAVEYIEQLGIDNLKLLVDLYHFDLENEDFSNISKFKDYIKHVHVAAPKSRIAPKIGDGYDYGNFINVLKSIGYDGLISIEANAKDFETEIGASKLLIESLI